MRSPSEDPLRIYSARRIETTSEFDESEGFNELRRSYRKKDKNLNRRLVTCLGFFGVLFLLYLWFLFKVYPKPEHHRHRDHQEHSGAQISADLLDLTRLNNFKSPNDKRAFIERELKSRLERYGGDPEYLTPIYDTASVRQDPNATEFSSMFDEFLKNYNRFLSNAKEAKDLQTKIANHVDQYNQFEAELQQEKDKLLGFIQQEDGLTLDPKPTLDIEIQIIQKKIDNEELAYSQNSAKLLAEKKLIDESKKKIRENKCDDVPRKIEGFERQQNEHWTKIDDCKKRTTSTSQVMTIALDRIHQLEREIGTKQNAYNLTQLDYLNAAKTEDILYEINHLENAELAHIQRQMKDSLDILKAKFLLLSTTEGLEHEEYLREKSFYINTTIILKQHVQLLIKIKSLYAKERKLALEGVAMHGSALELKEKLTLQLKDIDQKKKELASLNKDVEGYKKIQDQCTLIVEQSTGYLNQLEATKEESKKLNVDCLGQIERLQKEVNDFDAKKKKIDDTHFALIDRWEKDKSEKTRASIEDHVKVEDAHRRIYDLQLSINNIITKLVKNFNTMRNQREKFIQKDSLAKLNYDGVLENKQKIVEYLSRVDPYDTTIQGNSSVTVKRNITVTRTSTIKV